MTDLLSNPSPNDYLVERPGFGGPEELLKQRKVLAAAVSSGLWRTDPAPLEEYVGSVRCLRFVSQVPLRGTVIHFHGGGFRLGCPEQVGQFAARLALQCGVEVVCPAYRLAPEHPFPAGLIDAAKVMAAVRAESHRPILISGDSAGGGLAAGLAAYCAQIRMQPAALALLSPWLDLTVSSASYAANTATDPLFSAQSAKVAAEQYLQGMNARDPFASPLFGSLAGFPPTFVSFGSGEVLADDSRAFQAGLMACGIGVELLEVADMEHVAVTRHPDLLGSAETFAGLEAFVRRSFA